MLKIAVPTNRPQAVSNYLNALSALGAAGEAGRHFDPDDFDGLLLPGGNSFKRTKLFFERTVTSEGFA